MLRALPSLLLPASLAALALPACAGTALLAGAPVQEARADPVPIERIFADPRWIGRFPESPTWDEDGESLWFRRQRSEGEGHDWVCLDLEGRELEILPEERGRRPGARGEPSLDRTRRVWEEEGDLWLRELPDGEPQRLTRTSEREGSPRFLAGAGRIAFERGGRTLVRDLATGFEYEPAEIVMEDAPEEDERRREAETDWLARRERHLIAHVRESLEREEERERRREEARGERDAERREPEPYYLGDEHELRRAYLAPSERWMLVRLSERGGEDGRADVMPRFVTSSGYVETERVRPKVGTDARGAEALVLLDLEQGESTTIELGELPGIREDPLAEIAAGAKAWLAARYGEEPAEALEEQAAAIAGAAGSAGEAGAAGASEPSAAPGPREDASPAADETGAPVDGPPAAPEPAARPISFANVEWNEDGSLALVHALSHDNKDSWIAVLDPDAGELRPVDHLHDPAWVQRRFRASGWMPGGRALWFLSEESGWSQLYLHDLASGERRRLTEGEYEVQDVTVAHDGRWIWFQANREHPGVYELYRVAPAGGEVERLTHLGGWSDAQLSPDQTRALLRHSKPLEPPELYVQDLEPGAEPRRLTDSASADFRAQPWIAPRVVAVPSRHGTPIWSRLYLPPEGAAPPEGRRAVLFVHGAGYLQNAHLGWSSYFREFFFHSLLAHRGYVVLDMDYRASRGYGRDWRTAIYRRMGEPELEDLADGVEWLAREHGVDRARVGVYGGSYGGFLTLMALFRRPELFACGAALRPVTDWTHYNHGYTSNILNTPQIDPEAFHASSPIDHAGGLERPLLICHGMLDDNVLFQDTVRLAQRLIELGKQDWEVAIYPVEPHAFREPASWLDEYRRILALFERHL